MNCKDNNSYSSENIIEKHYSNDNKFRIEISDIKTDPVCEQQPPSLFDNPKRIRLCFFRIIDTEKNIVVYEISPSDEFSKKNKKCLPSSFPLAIAYGFDKFLDHENIIFTENYSWYAADDTNITTYKFNWKTCEKIKIFNLTEEHITRYGNEKIFNLFANNSYYAFYFFGENKTISVGKLPKELHENFPKNQDPFFSNITEEKPPYLFRENINIVFDNESNSLNFDNYKYPFLQIEINKEIKKFDIRKDLF